MTLIFQRNAAEKTLLNEIEINKKILLNLMENQKKSKFHVDNHLLDVSKMLDYVTRSFVSRGMVVNKIELLKIKTLAGVNVLPVKIHAMGNFFELIPLIGKFASSSPPVLINDFSLQMDGNGVMTAEMHLWIFAIHAKMPELTYQKLRTIHADTLLNIISFKKMKWVGFLRHKRNILGLLMLPGGQTVSVSAGSLIGVERGQVIEVHEDGIFVDFMEEKIKIGRS